MTMLDEKVAVVTGSARGIGRATAELLASQGARVVIADLDRDEAEETASAIDGETAVWTGNLTAEGAAEGLVETAIGNWGGLDIVVNNASYNLDAPMQDLSDADFLAMLDINVVVPFQILRAAFPHLSAPAEGEAARPVRKVVNISSVAAYGSPGQAGYSSGKAGIVGLTKTLAKEWGPLNICVNAVAFGDIETRLTQPKTADSEIEVDGRKIPVGVTPEGRAALDALTALQRRGTPAEAAGAVAFLCSPWSDFVSGQVMNVSGGLSVGMMS